MVTRDHDLVSESGVDLEGNELTGIYALSTYLKIAAEIGAHELVSPGPEPLH